MIGAIRLFSEQDKKADLVTLWNEYYGTPLFTEEHFSRFNSQNLIVIDGDDEMAGFAVLLDGGFCYAVLDALFLRPRYRRFITARDVFAFVEQTCQERGIQWFLGILDGGGAEGEKLVEQLRQRARWPVQYLGEKPVFCKRIERS